MTIVFIWLYITVHIIDFFWKITFKKHEGDRKANNSINDSMNARAQGLVCCDGYSEWFIIDVLPLSGAGSGDTSSPPRSKRNRLHQCLLHYGTETRLYCNIIHYFWSYLIMHGTWIICVTCVPVPYLLVSTLAVIFF